jgi:hypothetical protein
VTSEEFDRRRRRLQKLIDDELYRRRMAANAYRKARDETEPEVVEAEWEEVAVGFRGAMKPLGNLARGAALEIVLLLGAFLLGLAVAL